jgi:hypothetical protein
MSLSLNQYSTFWSIIIAILVLGVIVLCLILVISSFSPFKECEDKSDKYIVKLGNKMYTCGELRAVNTTIAGVDK